jgi:hypothetical protein
MQGKEMTPEKMKRPTHEDTVSVELAARAMTFSLTLRNAKLESLLGLWQSKRALKI